MFSIMYSYVMYSRKVDSGSCACALRKLNSTTCTRKHHCGHRCCCCSVDVFNKTQYAPTGNLYVWTWTRVHTCLGRRRDRCLTQTNRMTTNSSRHCSVYKENRAVLAGASGVTKQFSSTGRTTPRKSQEDEVTTRVAVTSRRGKTTFHSQRGPELQQRRPGLGGNIISQNAAKQRLSIREGVPTMYA